MNNDKFLKYFNENDGFSTHNGIRLTKMEPGYAEAQLTITEYNKNFMGTLHGAVLFALADIVSGSALAAYGKHCVTLSSNITYIAPAYEGRVTAKATQISRTRRTATFDIEIKNDAGTLLCKVTTTMYNMDKQILFDEDGNVLKM